ncbi:putative entry exclusion protein TrbK-alt [Xanthobacter sp. ZOL 2024]
MDTSMLVRLGAVVFVALAITATAIEMTRKGEEPAPHLAGPPGRAEPDPLSEDLHRCARLGEAGGRDPSCLNAWAQNRARFLVSKPSNPQEAR